MESGRASVEAGEQGIGLQRVEGDSGHMPGDKQGGYTAH